MLYKVIATQVFLALLWKNPPYKKYCKTYLLGKLTVFLPIR